MGRFLRLSLIQITFFRWAISGCEFSQRLSFHSCGGYFSIGPRNHIHKEYFRPIKWINGHIAQPNLPTSAPLFSWGFSSADDTNVIYSRFIHRLKKIYILRYFGVHENIRFVWNGTNYTRFIVRNNTIIRDYI